MLNLNIGFIVKKEDCPVGIRTNSVKVDHAINLGHSDAVNIFPKNAALVETATTKVGNLVNGVGVEKSIKRVLDAKYELDGVKCAFISRENKVV